MLGMIIPVSGLLIKYENATDSGIVVNQSRCMEV